MRAPMRALCFGLPLLGLLAAHSAQAQINPFGPPRQTGLTNSDFRVLDDATKQFLARPDLSPGAHEDWKNPETGSVGSLTVKNTLYRKGFDCLAIGYKSMARGRPPNRTGALNWCKTPDGWKIG